jgi:hypothetical protein
MTTNIVYLQLFSKDATKLLDANNHPYNWKWTAPTSLNMRRAPVAFLSIQSCYCDNSTGTNAPTPRSLRLKIPSENMLLNENTSPYINYPIVAQLCRDALAGHWMSFYENNPRIQIPSNVNILEFDLIDGGGNVISINSDHAAGPSLNLIIKIEYPLYNEVQNTMIDTYAQSEVGMPRYNKL